MEWSSDACQVSLLLFISLTLCGLIILSHLSVSSCLCFICLPCFSCQLSSGFQLVSRMHVFRWHVPLQCSPICDVCVVARQILPRLAWPKLSMMSAVSVCASSVHDITPRQFHVAFVQVVTHTHTHIYMCVCVCVCIYISLIALIAPDVYYTSRKSDSCSYHSYHVTQQQSWTEQTDTTWWDKQDSTERNGTSIDWESYKGRRERRHSRTP